MSPEDEKLLKKAREHIENAMALLDTEEQANVFVAARALDKAIALLRKVIPQ